jgi:hypothetical protein
MKLHTSLKQGLVLFGILLVGLYVFYPTAEGFSSSSSGSGGDISTTITPILHDYPTINENKTSNNNYNQIWWRYPIFSLGSFEQITNNLKYHYNPDNGTCARADFCGAMYHDNPHTKSNVVVPLPPAEEGEGARVGYFRTEPNELYFSIPTNDNILY